MVISFEHNGIEYLNVDIDNIEIRQFLEEKIGFEQLQSIIDAILNESVETNLADYLLDLDFHISSIKLGI